MLMHLNTSVKLEIFTLFLVKKTSQRPELNLNSIQSYWLCGIHCIAAGLWSVSMSAIEGIQVDWLSALITRCVIMIKEVNVFFEASKRVWPLKCRESDVYCCPFSTLLLVKWWCIMLLPALAFSLYLGLFRLTAFWIRSSYPQVNFGSVLTVLTFQVRSFFFENESMHLRF